MNAFSDVELLQDFLMEAGEMLEDVDSKLVELEQNPEDGDLLNVVFRGFHTIKGGAGFLEAKSLVELCHRTENLFDKLRSEELTLSTEMMDIIMEATGEVHRMFGEMHNGHQPDPAPDQLLANLDLAIENKIGEAVAAVPASSGPDAPAVNEPSAVQGVAIDGDGLDWAAMYEAVVGQPPAAVAQASLTANMATEALSKQAAAATRPKEAKPSTPNKGKAAGGSGVGKESTIRVDTNRFDQILNLSGEIGLTKNRLNCL